MTPELSNRTQADEFYHPFFYPHGGFAVWLFIILELLAFGLGVCSFLYLRIDAIELFKESQSHLNQKLATINTLVLIFSGYFLAIANRSYRTLSHRAIGLLNFLAFFLGAMFLYLKYTEYVEKIAMGLTPGTNTFYDFYWMLTGFHAAHVLLGIFFLLYFSISFYFFDKKLPEINNYDAAVTYWHMCDLIWILLFTFIYLL